MKKMHLKKTEWELDSIGPGEKKDFDFDFNINS